MCCAFVTQLDRLIAYDKKLKGLKYYHIPNGGFRNAREGAKFKRMGVKKGVLDYFVARAAKGFHGLYIEFKWGKNKLTTEQKDFIRDVEMENYKTVCVYSIKDGIDAIYEYLGERQ